MKNTDIDRRAICFVTAIIAFLLAAQTATTAQAQQRKFKPGDRFEAGGGRTYEIQQCRVTNGEEECEIIAYQEGNPPSSAFWLAASMLRRFEQQTKNEKRRSEAIDGRAKSDDGGEGRRAEPPRHSEPERAVSSQQDADINVTAQQLYDEYRNNDAAKRKYVGRTVRVTGAVVHLIEQSRFAAKHNRTFLGSTVQCYVEDSEQLTALNEGETLTLVGNPLGSLTSTGVIFDPCCVERRTAAGNRRTNASATPASANTGIAGTWYYTAIIKADGAEQKLTNSESYLWLKEDGTYENRFGGRYGQTGGYEAGANRLTLNRENAERKVYALTLTNGGKTMTLKSSSGGYRLERE